MSGAADVPGADIDREALSPRAPLVWLGLLVFTLVFLKNAWVDEDAFITFRHVEQLFAGNGLRWNPHERVQAFTHPLWLGLLALLRPLTRDLYAIALVLSWLGCVLMLERARHLLPDPRVWLVAVLAMISSKSFFDFTASGLETPLLFLLLTAYLLGFVRAMRAGPAAAPADLRNLALLFSLILLTRHDAVLLAAPPLAACLWVRGRAALAESLRATAIGLLPFVAWTAFSLLYYGFPFPNTAYAKLDTGIPAGVLATQGLRYLGHLPVDDPLAFATILAGVALLPLARWPWTAGATPIGAARGAIDPGGAALAAGLLLHVGYVVVVGGDYMMGRFFAAPFLVALLALLARWQPGSRARLALAAAATLHALLLPASPLMTDSSFARAEVGRDGIGDQRGIFFPITSIGQWWAAGDGPFPDYKWVHEGRRLAEAPEPVFVRANMGFLGYAIGTEKIVIDRLGLTDPLTARLPSMAIWRIGHFPRRLPPGYVEGIAQARSGIESPTLAQYHERLRLITEGDLLGGERLAAIVAMNLGRYDHLLPGAPH